jgi:hypothetical protein
VKGKISISLPGFVFEAEFENREELEYLLKEALSQQLGRALMQAKEVAEVART